MSSNIVVVDNSKSFIVEVNRGFVAVVNETSFNVLEVGYKRTIKTILLPYTWNVAGEVKVPSGDTDFINPFFIKLPTGQTAKRYGSGLGRSPGIWVQALSALRNGRPPMNPISLPNSAGQ